MSTQSGYVVFEDLEKATGPKVHSTSCCLYQIGSKGKLLRPLGTGLISPRKRLGQCVSHLQWAASLSLHYILV
jgi:hypothetical protein